MESGVFLFKICCEAIVFIVSIEIAFFLLFHGKRDKRGVKLKRIQPTTVSRLYLGVSLFMIFNALSITFYLLRNWLLFFYTLEDVPESFLYYLLSILKNMFIVLALTSISIVVVSNKLSIFPFFSLIVLLFPLWMAILHFLITCVFSFISFVILFNIVRITRGNLRVKTFFIATSYILVSIGLTMMVYPLDRQIINDVIILPDVFILVGLGILGLCILSIPSFNEFFAPLFAVELYVTTTDGRIILRHKFKTPNSQLQSESEQEQMEHEVFASSIIGIDRLLHEISSTQSILKTLVHQDEVLLIEPSTRLVGVLIAWRDLQVLRKQLNSIVREMETSVPVNITAKEIIEIPNKNYLVGRVEFNFRLYLRKVGRTMAGFFKDIESFFSRLDEKKREVSA